MKNLRPYLLALAAFLLIAVPLRAAEAPKLDVLLGEYKKARTDVLGKLNQAYAEQADALTKQYLALPDLDGADRTKRFAQRLRDGDDKTAALAAAGAANDPLSLLQSNYAQARLENLRNVYGFYTTTAENLRRELLRTKDQAGANVLTAFLEKIKPDAAALAPQAPSTPPATPKSRKSK